MVSATSRRQKASTSRRRSNGSTAPTPTPATPSVADPVVDMLKSYGFEYELVNLPLASVNRKASQLNQARVAEPIDEDQVLIYAEQMRNGDKFPPIVVFQSSNGSHIVMDGNHRVGSADLADITEFPAYVVKDPSPAEIQSFTYEANTKHGKPTSLDDRLSQGIHLMEQDVPLKEAARRLGITPGTLSTRWDMVQADKRFRSIGIRKFDALNGTAKRKLDAIHSDPVLRAAAELVLEARLSSDDIARLVKDVNAIRAGEREQIRFIAAQREARQTVIKATAGGRIPVPASVSNLSRVTTTISRVNVKTVAADIKRLPADAQSAQQAAVSTAVTKLMDLLRAIQQQG